MSNNTKASACTRHTLTTLSQDLDLLNAVFSRLKKDWNNTFCFTDSLKGLVTYDTARRLRTVLVARKVLIPMSRSKVRFNHDRSEPNAVMIRSAAAEARTLRNSEMRQYVSSRSTTQKEPKQTLDTTLISKLSQTSYAQELKKRGYTLKITKEYEI